MNQNQSNKPKKDVIALDLHLSRIKNCGENSSIFYKYSGPSEIKIKCFKHRCSSYFCEHCAEEKNRKLRIKLNVMLQSKTLRFLTLTLTTNLYDPVSSLQKISHFFELFKKRLEYLGYNFQYFKVIELTKASTAHIHAFIDRYIDQKLMSNIWKKLTGSPIVDIRFLYNPNLIQFYILKYITKSSDFKHNAFFFCYKKRRYSYSRIFFYKNIKTPEWIKSEFVQSKFNNFTAMLQAFINEYSFFNRNYNFIYDTT